MGLTIKYFDGKNRYLSNFYEAPIEYNGLTYRNNEAAFQAQKVLDEKEREQFTELPPNLAKRLGRKIKLRKDWDDVKVDIMKDICRTKFETHPSLMDRLLTTGDRKLIEGNDWNDTFWGVDDENGGENHLGIILMELREEFKNKRMKK